MSKYLITGGCGFIGSHLADALIGRGDKVRIIDDLSTGKRENAPQAAELIIGSILDLPLLQSSLQGIEGVFHLAAIPSVQRSIDEWSHVHQVNSGATVQLFEAITKLERKIPVVYASSSAVYGDVGSLPIQEQTPPMPLSPYGIDKLAGEMHARLLWDVFQIPSLSFRFFNVFGPRQDPSSPYSGVISIFSSRIAQNRPVTIFGDGEQRRDFIYVADVVRMMISAITRPMIGAEIFNLCTGKGTTINQLADLIGEVTGVAVKKEYAPPREGDIFCSIGDPSKAKKGLELETQYSLKEGLMRNRQSGKQS